MKIYNISVLVEPKEIQSELDIIHELLRQIETDGRETIVHSLEGTVSHEVVKQTNRDLFPACLTAGTQRLAFEISLPTKKDLGRRWFLKRLEGNNNKTFGLIATSDVSVIHIEVS